MFDPSDAPGATDDMLFVKPGKWSLVVVTSLREGSRRFNALRTSIGGISQKVLATTLRELERDGFVLRTQYPSIPPRVEYELTAIGHDLLRFADAWEGFVRSHRAAVEAARREFDVTHAESPLQGRAQAR